MIICLLQCRVWCVSNSLDPTLTVDNVIGVMEKVTDDGREKVWSRCLGRGLCADINSKCSSEKELLHTCSDIYINCHHDSSWEDLARRLYEEVEIAAVEEVQSYLNPRGRLFQWVCGPVFDIQECRILCVVPLLYYVCQAVLWLRFTHLLDNYSTCSQLPLMRLVMCSAIVSLLEKSLYADSACFVI